MTAAAKSATDSACSVGSMIFMSCRRISGWSTMVLPKATRLRATVMASFRQRRIIAAARTPCEMRLRFTWSIICFRPRLSSPIK